MKCACIVLHVGWVLKQFSAMNADRKVCDGRGIRISEGIKGYIRVLHPTQSIEGIGSRRKRRLPRSARFRAAFDLAEVILVVIYFFIRILLPITSDLLDAAL